MMDGQMTDAEVIGIIIAHHGMSSSRSLLNHDDIISDHKWSCLTKLHLLLVWYIHATS